jgi:hypothetical protein
VKGLKPTFISILAVGLLAGSAVGVMAQDEEIAADLSTPVYVTWTAGEPASVIDGVFDEDAGEMRGLVVQAAPVEASDPRLSGLAYFASNGNYELNADGSGTLESRSWRLVNDDGSWTGTSTFVQAGEPPSPPAISHESGLFVGEGAYEGLVAFFTADYLEGEGSQEGVIFELSVPPVPDVPDVPVE